MKRYSFDLYPELIGYIDSIRDKQNIVSIITGITRFLINATSCDLVDEAKPIKDGRIRIVICVDKMSRVFLIDGDKIHSFCFPFSIENEGNNFRITHEHVSVTSVSCSVLSAVFNNSFEGKSIEYVMERYWDIATDFEIGSDNKENYGHLIVYMLLFEPGYLRLDYDKNNESEGTHPLNHIDVNYANPNTYKIGLPNKWNCESMINFVNIKKPCSVISD